MAVMIGKILFFLFLVTIEFLATTSLQIEPIQNSWDKLNHLVAFLSLYTALSLGYPTLPTPHKSLMLLLYGVQIELVQSLLPHRSFSLLDIVADGVGIAIGIVFVSLVVPRIQYRL